MAAVATKPNPAADDDEAWLYGDSENTENREPVPPGTGPQENIGNSQTSAADASQDKDDEDDDSDDDDDDVQVTIGDIKAFPMNNAGPGLYKGPGTYQKQPVPVAQKITTTNPGVKGVDVDAEGTINGVGVFEFSLDSLQDEEKPWRKPGADITDYFNYGFNEDTWRKYCQKQNRLRAENGGLAARPFAMGMSNTVVKVETGDSGFTPTPRVLQAKTPSTTGTIAVLGSTTASRRPMEEQMNDVDQLGLVPEEMNKNVPPPGMPPPGMGIPPPDYSIPPPGMPPIPNFPPAVPPPGMPVPPPPTMFTQPPPVPFYPQPVPVPNTAGYGERPPFSYDNTQTPTNYTDTSAKPAWDSRERDSYRERGRDRDRDSGDEDDYRYSRSRDYSSRDYDRGDFYRSRDSDRSRDRDRSRSRDRDRRQRDRDRDRDDKKSKSRKVKDEPDDSDYYKSSSSKHKKSKRSKRDKDDDRDASGTQSDG